MRKLLSAAAACCILASVISGFQPQLLFGQRRRTTTFLTASSSTTTWKQNIRVGDLVGSGSYGAVHLLQIGDATVIGKRPWLENELLDQDKPKERATRCRYYWEVEEHVFSKLRPHPQLPPYLGPSGEWMLFELIGSSSSSNNSNNNNKDDGTLVPAPTLSDLMKLDADQNPLAMKNVCQALTCDSYADALDRILLSLLTVLTHVHKYEIVHRDIKPSNLLVHNGTLLLMDFGSAADLEPTKGDLLKRRKGLEDWQRVAVSPIYAAPEIFIDIYNHPSGFDIFSSGLLFCQFVFSLLDERMDAGFHQQLEGTDWDLNEWLSNELAGDLRPQGLSQALEYLAERQGLWTLLEDMLAKDPSKRPSAKKALKRFQAILLKEDGPQDGPFFEMVIESMESCEIPEEVPPAVSRPLHFVATFSRKQPLGLVLSERDDENESPVWKESTKEAEQGEVFVKELVVGGQAEELGIFEVGDRLSGIGELAFRYGGFEKAVEMLQVQPKKAANVKLRFDRLSVRGNDAIPMVPSKNVELQIADSGAWSSKGRRKAQEDAVVLHEIHNTEDRSVLVAGIMDGHGGTAASTMVAEQLPNILNTELVTNRLGVTEALEHAWGQVCNSYRQQCSTSTTDGGEEECRADYDPASGILMANTGSDDLIAGTTASIVAVDEHTGKLTFLNCGDSRCVLVNNNNNKLGKGVVQFATRDHKPQEEEERFQKGKDDGLGYSLPQCSVSRWSISVGDYEYSTSRSLEGPFATSKGIISDPDVTTVQAEAGMIVVSASDGLWDVMDSSEVAMELFEMRHQKKMSARDAARALCNMAWNKGTSDNVSAVVVYL